MTRARARLPLRLAVALPFLGAVAVLLAVLVAHGHHYTWLTDDAFISFRYARNLLAGRGLVFNEGERVEGYSNFLWVLEVAALWRAGIRPEVGAHLLSWAATAATVATACALAWRTPVRGGRRLAVLAALALLATDRNVAIWTTAGGLETRQLTALLTLAWARLLLGPAAGRHLHVSVLLALATLTRPEGPLFFGLTFLAVAAEGARRSGGRPLAAAMRPLLALTAPYAAIVGAHLAFRLAYYGEWVPNTYFAKHVRSWPEMGWAYLSFATIEGALYLVVPLAVAGGLLRARATRSVHACLPLAWIAAHALYLLDLGGDHFELRPLDLWWPPLFVLATDGLLGGVRWAADRVRPVRARPVPALPFALALAVVLVYGRALQLAHEVTTAHLDSRARTHRLAEPIGGGRVTWLALLPGSVALTDPYDDMGRTMTWHSVATRYREHRVFAETLIAGTRAYEAAGAARRLPPDAVMAHGNVGILPFYLPELEVIDVLGLTDATIAKAGHAPPNRDRQMAHDRSPPEGYVRSRGANVYVVLAASSRREALARAVYALELSPTLYLPFFSAKPSWVRRAFAGQPLFRSDGRRLTADGRWVDTETDASARRAQPRATWARNAETRSDHQTARTLASAGPRTPLAARPAGASGPKP